MKGSGIPIVGTIPKDIPILIKKWEKIKISKKKNRLKKKKQIRKEDEEYQKELEKERRKKEADAWLQERKDRKK